MALLISIFTHQGLLTMSERVGRITESSAGWSAKQVENVAWVLWDRLSARLSTYRRRWVAAVLYAQLSNLSDAELERRGFARGDLHRVVSETAEH
jgi:hypothetical protein